MHAVGDDVSDPAAKSLLGFRIVQRINKSLVPCISTRNVASDAAQVDSDTIQPFQKRVNGLARGCPNRTTGNFGIGPEWNTNFSTLPVTLPVINPTAGRYYVRILNHGQLSGGTQIRDYTLNVTSAVLPAPTNVRISPNHGGNTGTVTVTISGQDLDPLSTITLTVNNTTISATSVTVVNNGQQLRATFDLTGQAPGSYNVNVVNSIGGGFSIPNGFNIYTALAERSVITPPKQYGMMRLLEFLAAKLESHIHQCCHYCRS
jgi:hypothetical protein